MKLFRAAIVGLILGFMLSCTISLRGRRLMPKYDRVDPRIETYVNEWLSLAKLHNLSFNREVSVGFMDINEDPIIGLTNYGFGFTEIDLDTKNWNRSTEITKIALVFHELTHAYCYREHDFGSGTPYSEGMTASASKEKGFFKDGCSLSIMCPYIQDDDCTTIHYSEYIEEMFNRCSPL